MGKTLILYTTHIVNINVEYFMLYGPYIDPNIDWVFIYNNLIDPLPKDMPEYIKVIRRENKGYDFGAWTDAILQTNIDEYDNFICLNSSCIGPFNSTPIKWPKIFLQKLNVKTGLVGATINCYDLELKINPHVQSYIFATTLPVLKILITNGIFEEDKYVPIDAEDYKRHVITDKEVKMSTILLQNGINIASLHQPSAETNYCKELKFPYHDQTSGINARKLRHNEVIFIKNAKPRLLNKGELQRVVNLIRIKVK